MKIKVKFVDSEDWELIERLTEDPDFDWLVTMSVIDADTGTFTIDGDTGDVYDALKQLDNVFAANILEFIRIES